MPVELIRCAALLALLAGVLVGNSSFAQSAPEAREMIDALKPARHRNLQVRPAQFAEPAASAAAAPATPPAAPAPVPVATPVAAPVPTPAPAPVAAPVAVQVKPPPAAASAPSEPVPSLSLAIPFEVNSARLRPESGAVLGNLVAAMLSSDLKAHRFVIEGHTDASGNPANNLRLSQARAEEVRLYLVALGVHPSRLKAVGKGSTELANAKEPGSPENRRVRVVTIE